jgi:hypothetical protein
LETRAYRQSLSHLDPITLLQIEEGDWDATAEGHMFKRHWFQIVDDYPRTARKVRVWDFAGTDERQAMSQVQTGPWGP